MSFLFGGGRPQPSSAEKIAAAEQEVELVSDMYKRYVEEACGGFDGQDIKISTNYIRIVLTNLCPSD